jgi:hypothetical protein
MLEMYAEYFIYIFLMCESSFIHSLSKTLEDNIPVTTDPENWEGATIPRNNVIAEDFAQHR